jgi:methyl-accepting chemotaxis protein
MARQRLAIVGAGHGGLALLDAFARLDDATVVLVSDRSPDAPAMLAARSRGIAAIVTATLADTAGVAARPDVDVVFEATGNGAVLSALQGGARPGVVIVESRAAALTIGLYRVSERYAEGVRARAAELARVAGGMAEAVRTVTSATDALAAGAAESTRQWGDLSTAAAQAEQRLAETDSILESISDLADQTAVLGMNAAIQAARAGEAGRGFGIVAGEVRALAGSSARSVEQATEILDQLAESVRVVRAAVARVEALLGHQEQATRAAADNARAVEGATRDVSRLAAALGDDHEAGAAPQPLRRVA